MRLRSTLPVVAGLALALAACSVAPAVPTPGAATPALPATPAATPATDTPQPGSSITVYSGRSEELVRPLIDRFESATGIQVDVRYADTAELAALLLDEAANTPADVYFAQDAGALGAVAEAGLLATLPQTLLDRVGPSFRDPDGRWVGASGRARVVVYDPRDVEEADLPDSIDGFTDPVWKGRLGWSPTNGSFQAFVTAYRLLRGEDAARQWLEGIQANEPRVYDGNTPIVQAVADGEIEAGFVNHYYLLRLIAEHGDDFPARNYFLPRSDPGSLVNVAGVGVLGASDRQDAAQRFVEFLLAEESQRYFAEETFEYPLIQGVPAPSGLPPLAELQVPELDLSELSELQETLTLMREVGVLP